MHIVIAVNSPGLIYFVYIFEFKSQTFASMLKWLASETAIIQTEASNHLLSLLSKS